MYGRISDCIKTRLIALIFLFYPFFFISIFPMITLKICVRIFSKSVEARLFGLGICMDDKLYIMEFLTKLIALFVPLYIHFSVSSR